MADLLQIFPNLTGSDWSLTSPQDVAYNCIAWAAGDTRKWWWPDQQGFYYWPDGVPREATLQSFKEAFGILSYTECADGRFEPAMEKIALYAKGGIPQHAARQLPSGKWTSKLGDLEDIEHDLEGIAGREYGRVVVFMQRVRTSA